MSGRLNFQATAGQLASNQVVPSCTTRIMSTPQVIPSNHAEGSLQTSDFISNSPDVFLHSSTVAILDSFLAEKAAEQSLFHELEEQVLHDRDSSEPIGSTYKRSLSVDEFRTAFAEDWQLSQFW